MSVVPKLGPVIMGTLLTADLEYVINAYCTFMHTNILRQGRISPEQSTYLDAPELLGSSYAILSNLLSEPWLRVIEYKNCKSQAPLKYEGWIALEILVENVDLLAKSLKNSPFTLLRPVANLEVSDNIRAVQALGPCGEVLYLTQVNDIVPPFQLPKARCSVDHLFIPILCTQDRDMSLSFYENISGNSGLKFETKITVLNQENGFDLDKKHPVATLQLKDNTLIEIDQINTALPPFQRFVSGIFMISFRVNKLPSIAPANIKTCPTAAQTAMILKGPSGEIIELIEETA